MRREPCYILFIVRYRRVHHARARARVDSRRRRRDARTPRPRAHVLRMRRARRGLSLARRELERAITTHGVESSRVNRRALETTRAAGESAAAAGFANSTMTRADDDSSTRCDPSTSAIELPREFRFSATGDGSNEPAHECARERSGRSAKPRGFAFFEELGSPRYHVAPMVDQSELAFRELCKRYGATLGYTPMIHARLFVESPKYRQEIFSTSTRDRPLLAQFCANDPEMLLKAASLIAPYCDGVDINFGCPQRIAKRGNYGAFLMDDWKTVDALIRKLDEELPVPVTAKIRVFDDLETTLKYAKMVEAAGAQLVAVHGRTREQKRCAEIRANWCVRA